MDRACRVARDLVRLGRWFGGTGQRRDLRPERGRGRRHRGSSNSGTGGNAGVAGRGSAGATGLGDTGGSATGGRGGVAGAAGAGGTAGTAGGGGGTTGIAGMAGTGASPVPRRSVCRHGEPAVAAVPAARPGGAGGTAGLGGASGSGSGGTSAGAGGGPGRCRAQAAESPHAAERDHHHHLRRRFAKYILRVPDGYDSSHAYRLVLAYAWSGSSAPGRGANYFTFATLDSKNTIFAAPDAADGAELEQRRRRAHRRDPRSARRRSLHRQDPNVRDRIQLWRGHGHGARVHARGRVPRCRVLLGAISPILAPRL